MKMKKNNILVTGGTGFFGCSLLDKIFEGCWSDYHFTILSRRAEEFSLDHPGYSALTNVDFWTADVRDLKQSSKRFDLLIHAAAPAVDSPDDAELYDIIVSGTECVLDFAREYGVEKVLYISSGGVYGAGTRPFAETDDCRPETVYGKAKLLAEKMIFASGIPAVVMRGFAFAGKHLRRDVHFAFGNFLADALAGRDIIIKGDGTPLRSYLHSDDLAEWMMTMLFRGRAGEIYNCGSDEALSIAELAERCRECTGSSSRIKIIGTPRPGQPVSSYVPDVSKARRELGLDVKIKLPEAIRKSFSV